MFFASEFYVGFLNLRAGRGRGHAERGVQIIGIEGGGGGGGPSRHGGGGGGDALVLLCCCAGGLFGAHLLKASLFNTIYPIGFPKDISSSSLQSVCF